MAFRLELLYYILYHLSLTTFMIPVHTYFHELIDIQERNQITGFLYV